MKRYRIIEKTYSNGKKEYSIQYKILKLFWIDLRCSSYYNNVNNPDIYCIDFGETYPKTSSYEEALNMIKWMILSDKCFIGIDDECGKILYLYTNETKLFGTIYGSYDYNKAINLYNKYNKEIKNIESKKVVYEC